MTGTCTRVFTCISLRFSFYVCVTVTFTIIAIITLAVTFLVFANAKFLIFYQIIKEVIVSTNNILIKQRAILIINNVFFTNFQSHRIMSSELTVFICDDNDRFAGISISL